MFHFLHKFINYYTQQYKNILNILWKYNLQTTKVWPMTKNNVVT